MCGISKLFEYWMYLKSYLIISVSLIRIDSEAEEPFMPESPIELLKKGQFSHLPWMTGLTSQEGAWYISSLYGQDSMEYLKEFDQKPIEATKALGGGLFDLETDEKVLKVLNFYTNGEPVADQKRRIPMSELASDLIFNAETLLAVHLQSRKSSAPVYFYQFNHRGNWTFAHEFEETKHDYGGVAHLDDISYFMR